MVGLLAYPFPVNDNLPPSSHRLDEDNHPTPFSADQIREACGPGRRNVYRVTAAGSDPYINTWWFEDGDAEGADIVSVNSKVDGSPISGPNRRRSTWLELQRHASYPVATTTVSTVRVTTHAGEYDAWCFQSEEEDGTVTNASFARDLPGPPVLIVAEKAGEVVFRSELIEVHSPRTPRTGNG